MNKTVLCYAIILLLTACVDNSGNENAFQTQIDAVDRAEEVEDKILEAARLQAEAIESNTE